MDVLSGVPGSREGFGCTFPFWFLLGSTNGLRMAALSPCRPVRGMSSVGRALAVQSACGCVGFGCAPRWGGKEKSVTPAAIRYSTDLLRALSQTAGTRP